MDLRTFALYARSLAWSFRWSLGLLAAAVAIGAAAYRASADLSTGDAVYAAWMALFAQPIRSPPEPWILEVIGATYPMMGVMLIGEGIVRLSLLLLSRQHGEKDWMKVMASVKRDHVVLCGLGHLGSRILDRLLEAGADVVAIEKDEQGRFLAGAKATGIPVLIRDMKDDQALIEAGVPHARVIIIATNDDMANLEVALDARRLNPGIKILMRMYDGQVAGKITNAFAIDQAFSSAALAAPLVAAMSHQGGVLATYPIGGVAHVAAETVVQVGSALVGRSVGDLESSFALQVLARVPDGAAAESPPAASSLVAAGDRLVIHARAERVTPLLAAAAR